MNSVHSQFARAVKVWLRDTALLSFTHRALLRLVTRTVLTLEDRQMGSGAFRIFFFFSSIEDRQMGLGGGVGWGAFLSY